MLSFTPKMIVILPYISMLTNQEEFPCADARDCVFFMHGILDTSMGWVSNGVTGSQAFAAYDQGFDVWLGNSRSNPPRVHIGERPPCISLSNLHLSSSATETLLNYMPSGVWRSSGVHSILAGAKQCVWGVQILPAWGPATGITQ